jgi:Domain of unknown function (DUF4349)
MAATDRLARRRGAALAAAMVGVLALAGCSAGAATDDSGAVEAPQAAAPEYRENGAGGGAELGGDTDSAAGDTPLAPLQERALVYTGTITVAVESVVQAADEASALVIGQGGIVAGDTRNIADERSQATLVLRVPADRFASTLDRLAKLGTEENRQVQADDVTEQLVDLDARIATQQASVDRIRALLAQAQNIGEIVSLESELTNRQAELDSLTQRRATMSGLVELATITVVLHEPSSPGPADETETGFLAGLRAGWDGFLASVTIVVTIAGWLVPWAIAIGIPLLVIVSIVRRRRRRAVAVPPAAD